MIFELLQVTDEIQSLIKATASEAEIAQTAKKQGMRTLEEHAEELLIAGVTSCAEVERVIGAEGPLEVVS